MDPVSIIVAAVVAGAASGLGDAVKSEVTSAYAALRNALRERFSDRPVVASPLERLERKPDKAGRQEALRIGLAEVGVDAGDELVELAQTVLAEAGTTAENVLKVAVDGVVRDVGQENVVSQGVSARNKIDVGRGARVTGVHQSNRSD